MQKVPWRLIHRKVYTNVFILVPLGPNNTRECMTFPLFHGEGGQMDDMTQFSIKKSI